MNSRVFKRAKDRFRAQVMVKGWINHAPDDESKAVCPYVTNGWFGDRGEIDSYLSRAILDMFPGRVRLPGQVSLTTGISAIWQFSNHTETTLDDVDAAYDRAAKLWKRDHRITRPWRMIR